MVLTPEQEWTLVACGLIAHADDVLEVGEWGELLRLVDERLINDAQSQHWVDTLSDRAALEKLFSEMDPPLPSFHEELLRQSWMVALSDGAGSEVELATHDRIAEKLGLSSEQVNEWRERWTQQAVERAELIVGCAGAMANLDGRMDSSEAVVFDSLLERMPVPVHRRLELGALLHDPPPSEDLLRRIASLSEDEKEAVLHELAPLVIASHRGERERSFFFEMAQRAMIPREKAEALLEKN